MNKIIGTIFFTGLFIIIMAFSCTERSKEIKVMSWNIWHGGTHGTAEDNYLKDSVNIINTIKVLKEVNPDVLLMQETYCCGMEIAKKAGFKYSLLGSSNLSIHSNFPISDTINLFKPFNSHGAKIKIHDKEIFFINIWLHYLPDYFTSVKHLSTDSLIIEENSTRHAEIKAIITKVNKLTTVNENFPIIVGGDFNSGSHKDWIEDTKEFHYDKVVEWPVSKVMENNSFKDSFREIYPNPKLNSGVTWGAFFDKERMSDRIDYIYFRGNELNVKDAKVIFEDPPNGFFNSDHRAVLSTFIIN